ncbi:hypothetical protein Scep_012646 [Stephania cephalantha]|uniref:DUF4283 domain-containing protein n=1 Tax=Stephania cephalantha TaxID=152367 RepID=A0AAP0P6W0_9MAGN
MSTVSFSSMEKIDVTEALEACSQKLSLCSLKDGENALRISSAAKGPTLKACHQSILARVASSQTIFKKELKEAMSKTWHIKERITFIEVADNILQIHITKVTFWVQVHGITLDCRDNELVMEIGENLGVVLNVEEESKSDGVLTRKYIWLRAAVELDNLVMREEEVNNPVNKIQEGGKSGQAADKATNHNEFGAALNAHSEHLSIEMGQLRQRRVSPPASQLASRDDYTTIFFSPTSVTFEGGFHPPAFPTTELEYVGVARVHEVA